MNVSGRITVEDIEREVKRLLDAGWTREVFVEALLRRLHEIETEEEQTDGIDSVETCFGQLFHVIGTDRAFLTREEAEGYAQTLKGEKNRVD